MNDNNVTTVKKKKENQIQNYLMYVIGKYRNISLLAGLLVVFAIFSRGVIVNPYNLLKVLMRASIIGIIATGQSLVLFSGGIDLSVGSLFSFSLVMSFIFLEKGYSPIMAAALGIIATMLLGIFNGVLVVRTKVPAFIITLSSMMMIDSINLTIVGAKAMLFDDTKEMVETAIGGIPFGYDLLPVAVWLIFSLIVSKIMTSTSYGYNLYSLGGNETAAKYSGVKIKVIKSSVYIFSAFFAALAAFLYIYRLGVAKPDVGADYLLQTVAAAVIGGTSLFGGEGNVMGTMIGAIIMSLLVNFMNIMQVNPYIQTMIQGIILILVVFILSNKMKDMERIFLMKSMAKPIVNTNVRYKDKK